MARARGAERGTADRDPEPEPAIKRGV